MPMLTVLAVDLEGTLISNAMSQFARPGLHDFLTFCLASFPRVVLFSYVAVEQQRVVLANLAAEGAIPVAACHQLELRQAQGEFKDLRELGVTPDQALLVDDNEGFVVEAQADRWIPIREYEPPYSPDDRELERVTRVLRRRLGQAGVHAAG